MPPPIRARSKAKWPSSASPEVQDHGGKTRRRQYCNARPRWIVTHASPLEARAQVSFAREGGSGTDVPDLSIEVDNFDDVHASIQKAGLAIEYGPAVETWGVRRMFVRDPFGKLVNILSHA